MVSPCFLLLLSLLLYCWSRSSGFCFAWIRDIVICCYRFSNTWFDALDLWLPANLNLSFCSFNLQLVYLRLVAFLFWSPYFILYFLLFPFSRPGFWAFLLVLAVPWTGTLFKLSGLSEKRTFHHHVRININMMNIVLRDREKTVSLGTR